jgi:hypothetical protein
MGLLKRWLSVNPNKIPPLIRFDVIGSHSVGMTRLTYPTLRLRAFGVKGFDLNGDGEFSVLDIDLSRETYDRIRAHDHD